MRLDNYARSLLLALGGVFLAFSLAWHQGRRLLAGTSKGHVHFFDLPEQGLEQSGKDPKGHTSREVEPGRSAGWA